MDNLQNEKWFQQIMQSEGGLNLKEPSSVGGKSYGGISQKTFTDWRKQRCQIIDAPYEVEDLAGDALGTKYEKQNPLNIPSELGVRKDVIVAFYTDYFKNAKLEILPECLKYIHADFFVNAGFGANKILQRMVGFKDEDGTVDGVLGSVSRSKISEMEIRLKEDQALDPTADDNVILNYHELKLAHYESIKEINQELYDGNIKGWRKRSQHILSELGEYFEDEEPTTSAIFNDADHESVFSDDKQEDSIDKNTINDIVAKVIDRMSKELPAIIVSVLNEK